MVDEWQWDCASTYKEGVTQLTATRDAPAVRDRLIALQITGDYRCALGSQSSDRRPADSTAGPSDQRDLARQPPIQACHVFLLTACFTITTRQLPGPRVPAGNAVPLLRLRAGQAN